MGGGAAGGEFDRHDVTKGHPETLSYLTSVAGDPDNYEVCMQTYSKRHTGWLSPDPPLRLV